MIMAENHVEKLYNEELYKTNKPLLQGSHDLPNPAMNTETPFLTHIKLAIVSSILNFRSSSVNLNSDLQPCTSKMRAINKTGS